MLSPKEFVTELNRLGCPMGIALYRRFCEALAVVPHAGTDDRGLEADAQGRLVKPTAPDGKPLQVDRPYDPGEVARARRLRSALERHLNLCACANKWPFELSGEQNK